MKRLIVYSFIFFVPFIIQGQQLMLEDAVNIALKNSLDIEVTKVNETINTVNNNIGIAGGLPSVAATGSDNQQLTSINQKYTDATRNTKRNNVGSNNISTGVAASMVLFNGFRVKSIKRQLEALQHQSEQEMNAQVQVVIADVMVKYYDIIRQQGYIKTLQQSIEVSRKKLEIVQIQRNVGVANNADLFQAQLDLNAQLQAVQSQQLVIDQGKADLLSLLTLNPDSSITIRDTILIDKSVQLNAVLDRLPLTPEVVAAEYRVRASEWIEKQVSAQRYPAVRINTGYNFASNKSGAGFSLLNESYGPFVNFGVSIPIYNGGIFKRQQEVARLNTRVASLQKDILIRNSTNDAVKNWQTYTSTIQQLQTEEENNKIASQLLNLVLQRFQLKQATIIEVRQAQQSFEESGYRLINLSYAAKSGEIELKRLASQLRY